MSRFGGRLRVAALPLAIGALLATTPVIALTPQIVLPDEGLRASMEALHRIATAQANVGLKKKPPKPKRGLPIKLGKDGRLTVLLIGSDWRAASGGERLDVLMVASIDPTTGKAAVVSIPRDLSGIPFAGGGNSGAMRVNSIYYIRYRKPGLAHARIDRKALRRFTKDIAAFLGTEIDYWALTRFDTFAAVINTLGGIRVDIKQPVLDPSYHSGRTHGIWFPAKRNYKLKGSPKCRPKPKRCHSALIYARSRHGTVGNQYNSDYRRAARQQDIVYAGVKKVLDQTGSGIALIGLWLKMRKHIKTNMPTTVEAAGQAYALLSKLKLPRSNMKVLAPSTWAYTASDGTVKPNLKAIRRWVNRAFYKVRSPG